MLGKRPFFLIIMVIASKTMLIAIINKVNSKVLNIIVIFVMVNFAVAVSLSFYAKISLLNVLYRQ